MDCYNSWANLRCSSCTPLGENLLEMGLLDPIALRGCNFWSMPWSQFRFILSLEINGVPGFTITLNKHSPRPSKNWNDPGSKYTKWNKHGDMLSVSILFEYLVKLFLFLCNIGAYRVVVLWPTFHVFSTIFEMFGSSRYVFYFTLPIARWGRAKNNRHFQMHLLEWQW